MEPPVNPGQSKVEVASSSLVTRSVPLFYWRDGSMILRWTAAGVLEAERQFRRVNGYRDLPLLRAALGRALPAENLPVAATG